MNPKPFIAAAVRAAIPAALEQRPYFRIATFLASAKPLSR